MIVWPRFILLVVYINMLWLYYLLASSEELRMEAQYGDIYREHRLGTSMFLPGEPGRRLMRWLLGWIRARRVTVLVQAMDGNRSATHLMIDAGMTHSRAASLPLTREGVKLVFSRRKDRPAYTEPFSPWARWQPVFIAEMNGQNTWRVTDLDPNFFSGNPVMPVF